MKKIKVFILFPVFFFSLFFAKTVLAQTNNYFVYLDWRSSSYAPEEYLIFAKPLPANGAKIELSANLFSIKEKTIEKQKVQFYQVLDTKEYVFSWSVNAKKLFEGKGANRFVYNIPRGIRLGKVVVDLSVFDSSGVEFIASKKIIIPISNEPNLTVHLIKNNKVIPLAEKSFIGKAGESLKLLVKPYFFNISSVVDLSYNWYEGKKKIEATEYANEIFEIKLPSFPASGYFKAVVYNNNFTLELGQEEIKIESR